MKNIKTIYINILNIQKLFIFGYFIFCLITISNCNILNGKYPYLKKLNNNRYILISDNGITFLDQTLTISSNSIEFENKAYTTREIGEQSDIITSTRAAQFSNEYNNLIIAMVVDKLYIFDSNETLLNNITTFPDFFNNMYWGKPYYFIPYKYIDNNYIIYILTVDSYESGCYLNIQNITYNNETSIISISEKITKTLSDEEADNIYNSIACELMNYNDKNLIYCLFGVIESFEIISLDIENNFELNILNTTYDEMTFNRGIFKSLSFPEKQEIIFCTFLYYYFECIKYNIKYNNYTKFLSFNHELFATYEYFYNLEYFEESDQFLLVIIESRREEIDGRYISIPMIMVINCDMEGNCVKRNYSSIDGISGDDIKEKSKRINPVIPFDKLSYHLLIYNDDNDSSKWNKF